MFENFVVFTEVIKLSSNVFWRMKKVNYHDKLLVLINKKIDISTFEEVIDVVEDKYLITEFIHTLIRERRNDLRIRWIKNIFKVIDYIDIFTCNNALLIYSSTYKLDDFVDYLVKNGSEASNQDHQALLWREMVDFWNS